METTQLQLENFNGKNTKITIISATFHKNLMEKLIKNVIKELLKHNVKEENIEIIKVAGSLELPFACKKIAEKNKPDAIIALGIIIRGETTHYELVTETTHQGLMKVQLEQNTPIIFGLIATENIKQAQSRINKNDINKGASFAKTALMQTTI